MKKIFLISIFLFTACTNTPKNSPKTPEKQPSKNEEIRFQYHLKTSTSTLMIANDPFESFNRRVYYFNYEFDHWILLPIVHTYKFILPQPVRNSVGNFFSNLYEPITVCNGILTLEGHIMWRGIERFFINTTIGLIGFFDVADHFMLFEKKRTLNDTLAKYGVNPGPYIILPFLGPSDLRNATSKLITFLATSPIDPINIYVDKTWEKLTIKGIQAVDFRSKINFEYFSVGTPFEYEYVRLLYLRTTKVREEEFRSENNE